MALPVRAFMTLRRSGPENAIRRPSGDQRAEHRRPGASIIIRRYGTWIAALVAASDS